MALRLIFLLLITCYGTLHSTVFKQLHPGNPTPYVSASVPHPFLVLRKKAIHSNFMHKQLRLQIVSKDVQQLFDCSDDAARRKIVQAREALGKHDHQVVTLKEFCEYWGLPFEEVLQQLKLVC